MAIRKNKKRIDPRYFLKETTDKDEIERIEQQYGVHIMVAGRGGGGFSVIHREEDLEPPYEIPGQPVWYDTLEQAEQDIKDRRAQQNLLDYQTAFDSQRQLYDAQRRNVEQGYEWEREAAQDIFEPQITSWGQRHATAQRQNELAYDRARQEYLDDVEAYERNRNRRYNVLTGLM